MNTWAGYALNHKKAIHAADHVGEDAQRAAHHHGGHDGQAVEAVGQVHGVAGAHDHGPGQRHEAQHAQRIAHRFEERHDQVGARRQRHREAAADPGLEERPQFGVGRRRHGERQTTLR
ncbi:hypothetical protein G6F22_020087 [Rhizopus arrhizus]|nr:hypothetical protein G6F22_020087 [Rhizopus arrhizus]